MSGWQAESWEEEAPRITPVVGWLLGLNIALYFLQVTIVDPRDVQLGLGFRTGDLGAGRWWSAFTYAFVHGGFWHLALNMYTLWAFGPRVERVLGRGAFGRLYVAGALGGWALHLLVPGNTVLIGASAAVLGVLLAYARQWPSQLVYLFGVVPMTIRWLVAVLVVMNLAGGMGAGGGGGIAYLAHLGGLAGAWLYLTLAHRLDLGRLHEQVAPVEDTGSDDVPPRAVPRSRPRSSDRDDIVAQSRAALAASAPVPAAPARATPTRGPGERATATALDAVLDKISATGLESLTAEERRLLDDASRKLRDDR